MVKRHGWEICMQAVKIFVFFTSNVHFQLWSEIRSISKATIRDKSSWEGCKNISDWGCRKKQENNINKSMTQAIWKTSAELSQELSQ